MRPTVAVIIPTMHDRNDLTIETISSVLNQTVPADEIIILTETGELSKAIAKWNYAIQNMKSSHFILLCDDDLLAPNFIEEYTKHSADIVYGGMERFGDVNDKIQSRPWGSHIKQDTVPFITCLISKDIFNRVGGYDDVTFCDWDFFWKCYEVKASTVRLDNYLFRHRQHKGQSSHRVNWQASRDQVLAKHGYL